MQAVNIEQFFFYKPTFLILCGLLLLFVLVVCYMSMKKKRDTKQSLQLNKEEVNSLHKEDEAAVVLLTKNHLIFGANDRFYQLTGMSASSIDACSIQQLNSLFPKQTRQASMQRLMELLKRGSGSIVTEAYDNGTKQLIYWQLFHINLDAETILYYLSFNMEPFPVQPQRIVELEEQLQQEQTKQEELALFFLSIEGIECLLEDTQMSCSLFMDMLKQELDLLENAKVVYFAPIAKEKFIIALSSVTAREHAYCWAQYIIEASHYLVYHCSTEHCATVKVGVALSSSNCHNAESMLTDASCAMNMLRKRDENGYYIYSSQHSS